MIEVGFDGREAGESFTFTEASVNKNAGAFGFEQSKIARAAGRQDGYPQADSLPPQNQSNQTFGMICPTRMTNKIKMNHYRMLETDRNGCPMESEEREQRCCVPTKKNQ